MPANLEWPALRRAAVLAWLAPLAACGQQNTYVPPPPPKVGVAHPLQQSVTPYLEATGNTSAINSVDLVARVQGFVQGIDYQDGAQVKKGTLLFVIEPEPYKLKVDQAKAALDGAKAQLVQSQAEFERQSALQERQVSTAANLDKARAQRDLDQSNVEQDQANLQQAQINYGYTQVLAPFDGTVTQRLVSIGQLVGANSATQLASIIQINPIWVNFNISERDVQTIRAGMAARGITTKDIVNKVPVEVGLQTDQGFPYKGVIDYIAPNVDPSTGTLALRGILKNDDFRLLPGYYVRVRVPRRPVKALLVPEVAIGSDQSGRYVLVVNAQGVVEQRGVTLGQTFGALHAVENGLQPQDLVVVNGLLRTSPGQKVEPEMQTISPLPEAEAN
ncbi:MAG TPA: efflux RND transporter periplasmic adaptor subunit [Methylovirgula sp.]|nr:efflux RND transporter periplasmic adaptor subunit [Methylovirgula sp.]